MLIKNYHKVFLIKYNNSEIDAQNFIFFIETELQASFYE